MIMRVVSRRYFQAMGMQFVDGALKPLPNGQWAVLPVEQQLDAVLYLGTGAEDARIQRSNEPCSRPGFLEERLRRITLTGIPRFEADAIEKLCAAP